MSKVWLDVPFSEKDAAKAAGARWDGKARRWFAPQPGMVALDGWLPQPDLPTLLPREDRMLGNGLFVDLIPRTCWFTNVRACASTRDWERIRRMVLGRAEFACEICNAEQKGSLEVHERWQWNEEDSIQTLGRLICLCDQCHEVTHFGLAQVNGRTIEAFSHLMKVTGMEEAQARNHVEEAFRVWEIRSRRVWTLRLDMIEDVGIALAPPPGALARAHEAVARLEGVRPRRLIGLGWKQPSSGRAEQ